MYLHEAYNEEDLVSKQEPFPARKLPLRKDYHGEPTMQTCILDLPDELLINITARLGQDDLYNLACSCRSLHGVALEELYKEIRITDQNNAQDIMLPFRLARLHSSLIQAPDIAGFVRHMFLTAAECDSPVENASRFFQEPGSLMRTVVTEAPETFVVRSLLHQVPNLRCLELDIRKSGVSGSPSTFMSDPIKKVFGDVVGNAEVRTQLYKRHSQLQTLSWHGKEFHWALAGFPRLEHLTLGASCRILPDTAADETSKTIRHLALDCHPGILKQNTEQYSALRPFLAHLVGLRRVQLTILTQKPTDDVPLEDLINVFDQGSFNQIPHHLEPLHSTLDHLSLTLTGPPQRLNSTLDWTTPASTFAPFANLKTLRIPFAALPRPSTNTVPFLPPALETLEIDFPTLTVYTLLARAARTAPRLRRVKLHTSLVRGHRYERFAYLHHPHGAVTNLAKLGISVEVTHRAQDRFRWWGSYDLEAVEIVRWMNERGGSFEGSVMGGEARLVDVALCRCELPRIDFEVEGDEEFWRRGGFGASRSCGRVVRG